MSSLLHEIGENLPRLRPRCRLLKDLKDSVEIEKGFGISALE